MELELALGYIKEAEAYIDSFIEIDESVSESSHEYQIIMEANEKTSKGLIGSIGNVIKSLIDAVKKMISNFVNFFKRDYMSEAEKKEYAEMKKFIKEHPDFGKLPAVTPDFAPYEDVYKSAMDKLDKELSKEDPNANIGDLVHAALDEKVKGMKTKTKVAAAKVASSAIKKADKSFDAALDFTSDILKTEKGLFTRTTLDGMLEAANHNALTAKAIKEAMDAELIDLEAMQKEQGKFYAKRFKTKIDRYSDPDIFRKGRLALRRARIKILGHKEKTFRSILNDQKMMFKSHYSGYKSLFNRKKKEAMREYEANKRFFS